MVPQARYWTHLIKMLEPDAVVQKNSVILICYLVLILILSGRWLFKTHTPLNCCFTNYNSCVFVLCYFTILISFAWENNKSNVYCTTVSMTEAHTHIWLWCGFVWKVTILSTYTVRLFSCLEQRRTQCLWFECLAGL